MTLKEIARNRANLERAARIKHNKSFDKREQHTSLLLVFALLASGAFFLSLDILARLDDQGAKPGPIYLKSELSKQQVAALNIMPAVSEKISKR